MTKKKKNILYVNHYWGGGTEKHVYDLIQSFGEEDGFFIYFAKFTEEGIYIHEYINKQRTESFFFRYDLEIHPIKLLFFKDPNTLFRLLCAIFKIDLIHFHHFIHMGNLFSVIKPFETPYIVTLHDFFSICPTINLLNTRNTFCGACRPKLDHSTEYLGCMAKLKLTPNYLFEHRSLFAKILKEAKRIYIPNRSMEKMIFKVFGRLRSLRIFEHGHNKALLGKEGSCSYPEKHGNKLRILLLGNIADHKGFHILKSICNEKVLLEFCEFELWGSTPSRLPNVIYRGMYSQESIHNILAENQYDLSLQLSITAESFSYTISELIQNRIPVICFNLGAQAERVVRLKAGWVVESIDKNSVMLKLMELNKRREDLEYVKKTMEVNNLKSMFEMKSFYKREYIDIINESSNKDSGEIGFDVSDALSYAALDYKNRLSGFKDIFSLKKWPGLMYLLKKCYFSLKTIQMKLVNRKSIAKGFHIL